MLDYIQYILFMTLLPNILMPLLRNREEWSHSFYNKRNSFSDWSLETSNEEKKNGTNPNKSSVSDAYLRILYFPRLLSEQSLAMTCSWYIRWLQTAGMFLTHWGQNYLYIEQNMTSVVLLAWTSVMASINQEDEENNTTLWKNPSIRNNFSMHT